LAINIFHPSHFLMHRGRKLRILLSVM
jgi:hypothetical protein